MTLKDKARYETMLGYSPCFVTWGNDSGTHVCIRQMGHANDHWSGCCNAKISREQLRQFETTPQSNVSLPESTK